MIGMEADGHDNELLGCWSEGTLGAQEYITSVQVEVAKENCLSSATIWIPLGIQVAPYASSRNWRSRGPQYIDHELITAIPAIKGDHYEWR